MRNNRGNLFIIRTLSRINSTPQTHHHLQNVVTHHHQQQHQHSRHFASFISSDPSNNNITNNSPNQSSSSSSSRGRSKRIKNIDNIINDNTLNEQLSHSMKNGIIVPYFVDYKANTELPEDFSNETTYPYYISQVTLDTIRAITASQLYVDSSNSNTAKAVVLSCPHAGARRYLDATIRAVARELNANLISLDYPSIVRSIKLMNAPSSTPENNGMSSSHHTTESLSSSSRNGRNCNGNKYYTVSSPIKPFPISKAFSPSQYEAVRTANLVSRHDQESSAADEDDAVDLYDEWDETYDDDYDMEEIAAAAAAAKRRAQRYSSSGLSSNKHVMLSLIIRPESPSQNIMLSETGKGNSSVTESSDARNPYTSRLNYYAQELSQHQVQTALRDLKNFIVESIKSSPRNNMILYLRDLTDILEHGGPSGQFFVQCALDLVKSLQSQNHPIVMMGGCHPSLLDAGNLNRDANFYHILFDGGTVPKDASIIIPPAAKSQYGGLNLWHGNQLFATPIDQAVDSFVRIEMPPPYSRLFLESHPELDLALDKWLARLEIDLRGEVAETNWANIRMACLLRGIDFSPDVGVPPGREGHQPRKVVNRPLLEQSLWPLERVDRLVSLAVGQAVVSSISAGMKPSTPLILSHHHFVKALSLIQDGDLAHISDERFGNTDHLDDKLLTIRKGGPGRGKGGGGSNAISDTATGVPSSSASAGTVGIGGYSSNQTNQQQQQQQFASTPKAEDITKKNDNHHLHIRNTLKFLKSKGHEVNQYEKKILNTVVDPANIPVGFSDLVLPPSTKLALQTLVTLPLLRPSHFATGILSQHSHHGVLLFGPPGTGKTLLAKAVAKASGARFMGIALSDVFDKYVGEGEKHIRAIFSLARKLAPVIIFMDEIDGIFSARRGEGWNASRREIINEAMSEWDGLNSSNQGIIVLGATNRPFDLDDAVLRRMPRRILIDLPTEQQRANILALHLSKEKLDSSVSIETLAKRTPIYSGSDLKNLAVSAALTAVKESVMRELLAPAGAEMSRIEVLSKLDFLEGWSSDKVIKTGANAVCERVLHVEHFEAAFKEIPPSLSEDTQTLLELRKWDEKFGDAAAKRRGANRRGWGFDAKNTSFDTTTSIL